MTYQQLEVMRLRALELGLACEWLGERHEDEAWLRVADGEHRIMMCWFPGRRPIVVDVPSPSAQRLFEMMLGIPEVAP